MSLSPAQRLLMVRPRSFRCNEETVATNAFQIKTNADPNFIINAAQKEFDDLQSLLLRHGLDVRVFDEPHGVDTPDALFPNNWFAVLPSGQVFLFPMQAVNRRREVNLNWVEQYSQSGQINDLRKFADSSQYLEGTGSLILDHTNKIGYACLSPRSHPQVIQEFEKCSGYKVISFTAVDKNHTPFYHTNVMMAIGGATAFLCADSILDSVERQQVIQTLTDTGHKVVNLSQEQISNFCGNMLQVANTSGAKFWVCSERAHRSLTSQQRAMIEVDSQIISVPLPIIENVGGGSARCMIGELF